MSKDASKDRTPYLSIPKHLFIICAVGAAIPFLIRIYVYLGINLFNINLFKTFLIEEIWKLLYFPAILMAFFFGLRLGLLFTSLLCLTAMAIEVVSFYVKPGSTMMIIWHAAGELTLILFVTGFIGMLVDRLKRKQEYLKQVQQSISILDERQRLGRELHDSLAQQLVTIKLKLELAVDYIRKKQLNPGLARLTEIRKLVDLSNADLRSSILDLKSDVSDKSINTMIHECLNKVRRLHDMEVIVHVYRSTDVNTSLNTKTHLIRIIQEVLTNIRKHSGVNQAFITLTTTRHQVTIVLEDRGKGFEVEQAMTPGVAYGLISMKERATLIGAELVITSKPGMGTRVTIKVPVVEKRGRPL